jgi:hypothetical protein
MVRRLLLREEEPSPAPPSAAKPAAPAGTTTQARPAPKQAAAPTRPAATKKEAAKAAAPSAGGAWVEPQGDACPASHQVKAKLSSGIYHVPGMLNYDRTTPDRCYIDVAAAEADGLRPAKR